MRKQVPNVVCLQVHLPDLQPIIFNVEKDAHGQDIITEHKGCPTTLIGWFEANAALPEGDPKLLLLYQDYPSENVWNANGN
jgi:hypothetical protein